MLTLQGVRLMYDNFDYFDMWEQEQARQEKLRLKEEEWERQMDEEDYDRPVSVLRTE